jgi:hypothetical protein
VHHHLRSLTMLPSVDNQEEFARLKQLKDEAELRELEGGDGDGQGRERAVRVGRRELLFTWFCILCT